MKPELHERWRRLWEAAGAQGDATPHFADVALRYSEPHRAYHTLVHIEHCLAEFDEVKYLFKDPIAAEFALWLHDVIYDPRAKENELASADYAKRVLTKAGVPKQIGARTYWGVLSTATHDDPESSDNQLIVDIDLAILGQCEERFNLFEKEIRYEYAWVPDESFRQGRASVLRKFYERPRIYFSEHFRAKYESLARVNLARTLAGLERPL